MYIVEKLVKVGVNVNFLIYCGLLLVVVCEKGNINVVKKLIRVGVDVNVKSILRV